MKTRAEWLLEFPPTLNFIKWLRHFPRLGDALDMPDAEKEKRGILPGFIAFIIIFCIFFGVVFLILHRP